MVLLRLHETEYILAWSYLPGGNASAAGSAGVCPCGGAAGDDEPAGECRAVANLEQRVKEAARLGFTTAIVPFRNIEKRKFECEGINIIPIRGIYEVLNMMKKQD